MTADTARVLEIAAHLRAPGLEALHGLARAISPVAPGVDQLGHGLAQSPDQLGPADERGEQPVDRFADRLEAGGLA